MLANGKVRGVLGATVAVRSGVVRGCAGALPASASLRRRLTIWAHHHGTLIAGKRPFASRNGVRDRHRRCGGQIVESTIVGALARERNTRRRGRSRNRRLSPAPCAPSAVPCRGSSARHSPAAGSSCSAARASPASGAGTAASGARSPGWATPPSARPRRRHSPASTPPQQPARRRRPPQRRWRSRTPFLDAKGRCPRDP